MTTSTGDPTESPRITSSAIQPPAERDPIPSGVRWNFSSPNPAGISIPSRRSNPSSSLWVTEHQSLPADGVADALFGTVDAWDQTRDHSEVGKQKAPSGKGA